MKEKACSSEEVYQFTSSLAVLLKSGISLQEGFSMMLESEASSLYALLEEMLTYIEKGDTLFQAMEKTHQFPTYALYLTRIGEECGCLDIVMSSLSAYYEREMDMKLQLRNAITYPMFLLIMMFLVVGILVFKILPVFQNVLHSLGSELSSFALSLMRIGSGFASAGFLLLIGVLLILCILYYYQKHKKNQDEVADFFSRFLLTRKLYRGISMAQMTYAFSLFLSSGADLSTSMKQMQDLIHHPKLKQQLIDCEDAMQAGENFATSIRKAKLYRGMEASMLEVGFRSGQGDEVMRQLASDYEKRVSMEIADFLNILEPTIVAVLSMLVGMILLSVMLPLMSIMTSLG